MRSGNTWADIVHTVENSGVQQEQEQQQQKVEREIQYKMQLKDQITFFNFKKRETENKKVQEREMAEQTARMQRQKELKKREKMRNVELQFQLQNLSLMQHRPKNAGDGNKYQENPFVQLVDREDERRIQQRRRIENYYLENRRLLNEKVKRSNEIKLLQKETGSKFKAHVESTFELRERDRKQFERKFLKNSRTERVQTEPDSLSSEYAQFLSRQIAQKDEMKKKEQQLDQVNSKIHAHISDQAYSPAFLGRIPQNYDRKKQISYIDRQLKSHKRNQTGNHTEIIERLSQLTDKDVSVNFSPDQGSQVKAISQVPGRQKSSINTTQRKLRQFNVLTGSYILRNV